VHGEELKRLRNEREVLADRFRAMRAMGLRHLSPEERRTAYDALRLTAHVDEKGDVRITGIFDADLTELPARVVGRGEGRRTRVRCEHEYAVAHPAQGRCWCRTLPPGDIISTGTPGAVEVRSATLWSAGSAASGRS
jgi:2-keto-4-pentenoate hydratase/2-oxohepta-3-ene-1,7-dioic acid hydratase in catechol pathway